MKSEVGNDFTNVDQWEDDIISCDFVVDEIISHYDIVDDESRVFFFDIRVDFACASASWPIPFRWNDLENLDNMNDDVVDF